MSAQFAWVRPASLLNAGTVALRSCSTIPESLLDCGKPTISHCPAPAMPRPTARVSLGTDPLLLVLDATVRARKGAAIAEPISTQIHWRDTMKTISIALAITLLSTSAAMAEAPMQDPHSSRVVAYADLDLERETGVQTLYRRITAAAREVCQPTAGILRIYQGRHMKRCVNDAVERAIADADRAELTRFHAQRLAERDAPKFSQHGA